MKDILLRLRIAYATQGASLCLLTNDGITTWEVAPMELGG